jgi:penicillin-binding protein 1A
MLAGVIAAPSDYSPFVNLPLARDRQQHVLERMVENGYITQAQADQAASAPLQLISERSPGLQGYLDPYFTTYVIQQLETLFGSQAVEESGLQVYTTVDPNLEKIAQEAVDWGVRTALAEGINAHQAALVSIRPSTGEIVAMIGGTNFSLQNQFNRAWQARRQPGSSFKAYVYTAAIDGGMFPTSIMEDTPVQYPMGDGTNWAPKDDDFTYMGAVTLRRALAFSRNIVAVKLADQIGVDRVIEYAHSMGIQSPLEANLSLALGSSVVSVLDQASGYQTLANQGVHIEPVSLRLVKDSLGNSVLDNQYSQASDVVSAGTAYIMTSMLQDVIAYGTGTNANIGRPAAGKTGTTSDFRDAWFVGYTPDLVTAVWLGNDDYARMYESFGGNIPARIWARYMKAALQNIPKHDFAVPTDQVQRMACPTGTDYYLIATAPAGCHALTMNSKYSSSSATTGSTSNTAASGTTTLTTGTSKNAASSTATTSTPSPGIATPNVLATPLPTVAPLATESP